VRQNRKYSKQMITCPSPIEARVLTRRVRERLL